MLRTRGITDIFNAFDEIYFVFTFEKLISSKRMFSFLCTGFGGAIFMFLCVGLVCLLSGCTVPFPFFFQCLE